MPRDKARLPREIAAVGGSRRAPLNWLQNYDQPRRDRAMPDRTFGPDFMPETNDQTPDEPIEPDFDPENIYDSASIRQSIEEDRK